MAQSINTRVDVVVEATSYQGLTNYGKIMVGDKGLEFFNTRNVNDYIQIPWGYTIRASCTFFKLL